MALPLVLNGVQFDGLIDMARHVEPKFWLGEPAQAPDGSISQNAQHQITLFGGPGDLGLRGYTPEVRGVRQNEEIQIQAVPAEVVFALLWLRQTGTRFSNLVLTWYELPADPNTHWVKARLRAADIKRS